MPDHIRFSGKLSKIKIDGDWDKKLDRAFAALVRAAAKAFVREILIHVPVWTGMAKGSIKFAKGPKGFLLAYLNNAVKDGNSLDANIGPTKSTPRYYRHPGRVNKIRKTPMNGGKFAKYNFAVARKVYSFSFRDDVVHFIINDFYGSHSVPSPWNATDQAKQAFDKYIQENAARLIPRLESFFSVVDVIV